MSHANLAQPPDALKTGNALDIKTAFSGAGYALGMVQGVIDCRSSAAQLIGYLPTSALPPGAQGTLSAIWFFPIKVMCTIREGYGVNLATPTINVGVTGTTYSDWCSNAAIGKITGGSLAGMITSSQYAEVQIKSTNKFATDTSPSPFAKVPVYAKMQTVSDAAKDIRSITIYGWLGSQYFY